MDSLQMEYFRQGSCLKTEYSRQEILLRIKDSKKEAFWKRGSKVRPPFELEEYRYEFMVEKRLLVV